MGVLDRKAIDRAAMFARNIWRGSNVTFCVAIAVGVRQFIRFRWVAETQSHVEVARFEPHEKRVITFALCTDKRRLVA